MKRITPFQEKIVYQAVLDGEFEIDQLGQIWRIRKRVRSRWKENVISIPCKKVRAEHKTGSYLQVRVMYNNKRYYTVAQRLVYMHFKGEIPDGLVINHLDGNKKNNHPDNLEITTPSGNTLHSRNVLKVGRLDQYGERNSMSKLTVDQIHEIRSRRYLGEPLLSIAKDFNVTDRHVSRIARRTRWAHI